MLSCAGLGLSRAAYADGPAVVPHGTIAGAHAVGGEQQRELGFGVQGGAGLELELHPVVGLEAHVGGLVLAKGSPPEDPNVLPRETGTAFFATGGVRVHPFASTGIGGPWASGRAGLAQTGNLSRLGVMAEVGWDFRPGASRFLVGPYAGYTHVLQGEDSFRPGDARVVSLGLHVAYGRADAPKDRDRDGVLDDDDACPDVPGPRTRDPRTNGCPAPKDRDRDGVLDVVDACPDVPGVASADPSKNGCPGDRDGDGIADAVDACPAVPGVRTDDPRTNGCPADTDKDGVVDAEDACRTVPGVRTSDPRTNGCPDRDRDGVADAEDACPEVPGPRTSDPATNGCPPRDEKVHVEGDRILLDDVVLFDTDSPRVRHASYGILRKVAKFIAKNRDILEVSVEGHADAVGTDAHNQTLSRARAESVVRLLRIFEVGETHLKAEAFGRSRLKIATPGPERRNRRVELFVTRVRVEGGDEGGAVERVVKNPDEVKP